MKIIFFDGYCSLCNGFVDFMISHDHSGEIQFASLQGKTALEKIPHEKIIDLDTVVYLRNGKLYDRSDAILHAASDLGGVFKASSAFLILPKSVRDLLYRIIAQNRYRLFGKRETCRLPTPEEKSRLLP